MNIGILSGKGGTGKTTISTNLASLLEANYVDCDVEEPNGFIFLKPENVISNTVEVEVPQIDHEKCIGCGKCAKACQFNALAMVKREVLHFEKLCHNCGACELVCQEGAISYKKRPIGVIESGNHKGTMCHQGLLNIGEPMAVPIIRELLRNMDPGMNIVDFSPGVSCNVVNALQRVDMAILVTEPTKFGHHDLARAVDLVRRFDIPFGVIINKDIEGEDIIDRYCKEEGINILGKLPYKKQVARNYSRGEMLIDDPEYKEVFERIKAEIGRVFEWS